MRKQAVSALMMTLLLLAGCGEREAGPEEAFAAFREELGAARRITAQAELTADYGGTAEEYVLSVMSGDGKTAVTVIEPELIAGVTATAAGEDTSLAYEGVILGAGPLDSEGTTPVSALPVILRVMKDGYAELYWRDGSFAAGRFYVGETTCCTVWLDPVAGRPTAAEIAENGRTVIICRFSDWTTE